MLPTVLPSPSPLYPSGSHSQGARNRLHPWIWWQVSRFCNDTMQQIRYDANSEVPRDFSFVNRKELMKNRQKPLACTPLTTRITLNFVADIKHQHFKNLQNKVLTWCTGLPAVTHFENRGGSLMLQREDIGKCFGTGTESDENSFRYEFLLLKFSVIWSGFRKNRAQRPDALHWNWVGESGFSQLR